MFRQAGETDCVSFGSFGESENSIVAGYLALETETLLDPDERWVQREEDKSQLLDQIDPIIGPTEMSHFVKNNLFELGWSEFFEEPGWDENPRGEEADDTGTIDLG